MGVPREFVGQLMRNHIPRLLLGTLVPGGTYLIKIEAIAENGQRVQALRSAQITR